MAIMGDAGESPWSSPLNPRSLLVGQTDACRGVEANLLRITADLVATNPMTAANGGKSRDSQ